MIASESLQPSSYSRPFHALRATCSLPRLGPVASHFGQTPWNCFLPVNCILPRAFRQNGHHRSYRGCCTGLALLSRTGSIGLIPSPATFRFASAFRNVLSFASVVGFGRRLSASQPDTVDCVTPTHFGFVGRRTRSDGQIIWRSSGSR